MRSTSGSGIFNECRPGINHDLRKKLLCIFDETTRSTDAFSKNIENNKNKKSPPYTRETGTTWQTGILTAEWSILRQTNVILGHFALRFQWKVHLCASNGLLARLVLSDIFCAFSAQKLGFGGDKVSHCPQTAKMCTVSKRECQFAGFFHESLARNYSKSAFLLVEKRSVQLWERQFAKSYLFHGSRAYRYTSPPKT